MYLLTLSLLLFQATKIKAHSSNDLSFCTACANSCDDGPNFYRWLLEEQELAPDNFLQKGKVINGEFPGPILRIFPNQILTVQVINNLNSNVTIHWHGLHQEQTVEADGIGFVTQWEIPVNGNYTYCIFVGDEPGTFMYHSHVGLDIIWIHGALIVEDFPVPLWAQGNSWWQRDQYFYHDERVLLLEQLYHESVDSALENLLVGGGRVPEVKSLLINGKSYGSWPTNNGESPGFSVIRVTLGKTYRFRLINLSSELLVRFKISGHKLLVIEMDGIYTPAIPVDHVDIHAGQRYSILVTMNHPMDNYDIKITQVPGPGPSNGKAILHYEGAEDPTPLRTLLPKNPLTELLPLDEWISSELYPSPWLRQNRFYHVPYHVDRTILIDFHLRVAAEGVFARFQLDGHIYKNPEYPYLFQLRNGINITQEPQVFEILEGQSIQMIFQNRAAGPTGFCVPHPWHLHGRFFHVIASGPDTFDSEKDLPTIQEKLELSGGKFEFRDTFVQYPKFTSTKGLKDGDGCGWAAIRFVANNPGLWLNHCHITSHMLIGKQFVIWEHTKDNPTLVGE